MKKHPPAGITLLETLLYVALFAMIIPSYTVFIMHVWQEAIGFDARLRLEATSSMLFLELTHALTEADAVVTSSSTLGSDASSLTFRDKDGTLVTVALVTTVVYVDGVQQMIRRIHMSKNGTTSTWMTDPNHDVTRFRIDAVRNSANALTGLRIEFNANLLNATANVYRNASVDLTTTIALSPHAVEQ